MSTLTVCKDSNYGYCIKGIPVSDYPDVTAKPYPNHDQIRWLYIPKGYGAIVYLYKNFTGKSYYMEQPLNDGVTYIGSDDRLKSGQDPQSLKFFKLVSKEERIQAWTDNGGTGKIPISILNLKGGINDINAEITRLKNSTNPVDRALFYGSNKALWPNANNMTELQFKQVWEEANCVTPTDTNLARTIYNNGIVTPKESNNSYHIVANGDLSNQNKYCLEYNGTTDNTIKSGDFVTLMYNNKYLNAMNTYTDLQPCNINPLNDATSCSREVFKITKIKKNSTDDDIIHYNDTVFFQNVDAKLNPIMGTLDCVGNGYCRATIGITCINADGTLNVGCSASKFGLTSSTDGKSSNNIITDGNLLYLQALNEKTSYFISYNTNIANVFTGNADPSKGVQFKINKQYDRITLNTCNFSDKQTWIKNIDNQLSPSINKQKCINNSSSKITDCSEGTKFDFSNNINIKVNNTDSCLNVPSGNYAVGQQLDYYSCSTARPDTISFTMLDQIQEVIPSDTIKNNVKKLSLSNNPNDIKLCYTSDINKQPFINPSDYDIMWKNAGCITNSVYNDTVRQTRRDILAKQISTLANATDDVSRTTCYGSDKTKWPDYVQTYKLDANSSPLILPSKSKDASIKTNITDETTLGVLANRNNKTLSAIQGYNINNSDGIKTGLNNVLSQTVLKAGCCRRNKDDNSQFYTSIRVPYDENTNNPTLKKFGFQYEQLNIPENACPTQYYKGSEYCDTFYDIYCENVNNEFKNKIGENKDSKIYRQFAPECACYAPKTPPEQNMPSGVASVCYKEGCEKNNNAVYPDKISRNDKCELTFCSSIVNASEVNAGKNVEFSPKIQQNCGMSNNTVNTPNTISPSASNTTAESNTTKPSSSATSSSSNAQSSSSSPSTITPSSSSTTSSSSNAPSSSSSPSTITPTKTTTVDSSSGMSSYIIYTIIAIVIICLLSGSVFAYKMLSKK